MRTELEPIWSAICSNELPRRFDDLFFDIFDEERNSFDLQETYIVDFKDRCPDKFSDDFGSSILRLALAFYNSFGGIIVFGVDDKSRGPSGLSVEFDVEAFNAVITEFTGAKFEALARNYSFASSDGESEICVVLIPKRGVVRPARLTKSIGKYMKGSLWVRERHEVLEVRPEHFTTLYSQRSEYPSEGMGAAPSIQRSLPPKPSTIKQFVGRELILADLWEWFVFGDQPRAYLHGPGGSGKSAIAFEFADSISLSDYEVRFPSGERLDYVLYLSGKETELDPKEGKIRKFEDRNFSNAVEIWKTILTQTGFYDDNEIEGLDEEGLEEKTDELLDSYSGLIILDDIDALSRRGVDTGEESLLIKVVSASKRSRVIYTLRQSPAHARKSSINVPGLPRDEMIEFIEVAREQFDVPKPDTDEIAAIETESNSLPLLIENILGLRRYCGSYEAAIRQHNERGGDDARRYLYQREYDHLDEKGRSREVLAALALIREPVKFATLADILDFSTQVVVDALAETSNIFLSMSEDESGETNYQISPVARPFIENASRALHLYEQILRKVKLFGREGASPEESALILRFERLLRAEKYKDVVAVAEGLDSADPARANPKVRALLGQAYANLGMGQRAKAVESFRFAESMGHFDIAMMRSWYYIENRAGVEIRALEELCLRVLKRPNLAARYRAEFHSKLGRARLAEARALRFVAREKSLPYYAGALRAFTKNLYLAQVNSLDPSKTKYDLSVTCSEFIATSRGDLNEFFKAVESLSDEKHDVSIEAAVTIVRSLVTSSHLPFSEQARKRFFGHVRRCRNKLDRAVKAISSGPGGQYLIEAFSKFERTSLP